MFSFTRRTLTRIGIPFACCLLVFGVQSALLSPDADAGDSGQILVADAGNQGGAALVAQARSSMIMPQVLYHRAWRLINETFYDQTFKGQDWSRWKNRYDGKLESPEDAYKAIETMLASLGDPYTRFLDKEAFDEERNQIEAHLFGVGMQLGMNAKSHKVVVITPIEGTPAYKAGILPGWEIVEVDDKQVQGESLDQVVKRIRGPIDSVVHLTFETKDNKRKRVKLVRAEIPIRAVAKAEILPENIGYIRLESFISSKANEEMREALDQVKSVNGLILDLRNNPGGLLSNAIEIANMFIDRGVIVSTIDSDGYKNSQFASSRPIIKTPMVVLINSASASASEILSGALRDNGRAKLVGQKTFGKGLVQAINRLEDGSGINVTIAKYLTPNDVDIDKSGIVPDFKVELKDKDWEDGKGPWWIDLTFSEFDKKPTDGKDLQLNKAIEVLKEQLGTSPRATASAKK